MKRFKEIEDSLDKKLCRREAEKWLTQYKSKQNNILEKHNTWPRVTLWRQPGRVEVADAVYQSGDYMDWQMFRVGLKGLTTKDKLRALWCRLTAYEESATERVRVNNYIGALKRGGQLNDKLEIAK